MFGQVTEMDRLIWQRRGAKALAELMDEAFALKLPQMTWQLNVAGTLAARCLGPEMTARRAAFEQWTEFLGTAGWREWEDNGVVHLYAITEGFRGCQVTITADLYDNGLGDQQ